MSPAVTGPLPFFFRVRVASSRPLMRIATPFRLSRMSMTSSCTPSMVEYSWSTPSISTSVMAAPAIEESMIRRRLLPRVCPNPRSNGSSVILAWRSLIV
jgi:hypothetical protein